jgi:16S rRNA (uracil1498-N3)-methyltransferase
VRTTRCHVDTALAPGQRVLLPEPASQHLLRVLRLRAGDRCRLFNGDGHDYPARLLATVGKRAEFEVEEVIAVDNESPLSLQLAQGIARGEKMDLILQKATELGVAEIHPLFTLRTEVRLDAERMEKRLQHWRGVISAACEQCGRARLPLLHPPRTLAAFLGQLPADAIKLVLDPQGGRRLDALEAPGARPLLLLVGPEGGLDQRDLTPARAAGFEGLRLGPRILRTETAGLAAIAALQARLGDLG